METRFLEVHVGNRAEYVPLDRWRPEVSGRPTIVALPIPRPYGDWGKIVNFRIEESLPDAAGALIEWLVNKSGWTVEEDGATVSICPPAVAWVRWRPPPSSATRAPGRGRRCRS